MQRRTFIRLAGGGTIAAAAAGGAAAWTLGGGFPEASLEAWRGPGADADPRRRALAFAITAPNPHNLQPWVADLREPGVITVTTDPQRVLPATDPQGRQILVGHGAFLELLVMALAEQGLRADVTLWPQGELGSDPAAWDRRPVARLQLAPGGARDPLFAQVLARHTPKVDFDPARPVAAATLDGLLGVRSGAAVLLGGTIDPGRMGTLRTLCWESAQAELRTRETVMESVRLLRIGPDETLRHRDGISINAPVPRVLSALGLFDRSQPPAEGSPAHTQMMDRFRGHSATAMGFAWVATPGNTRAQQVEAGRAYVRLQLKATELGVGMHPMSQALQEFPAMRSHYEQVHRLLLGRGAPTGPADPTVQMFVRLGYPSAPVAATPRRPLAAFLA